MEVVEKDKFVSVIKTGDAGIIHGNNLFAKLQSLYAHRFSEGPVSASHTFYVSNAPFITEANGAIIKGEPQGNKFLKNIGDQTKCWFFRSRNVDSQSLKGMNAYAKAAVDTAGHYSVGGILQFAKCFVTGKRNECDEGGVFCSEFVSDVILEGLPTSEFIEDRPTWQITPSYLLNWMLSPDALKKGWFLAAHYNGEGQYFIADELSA